MSVAELKTRLGIQEPQINARVWSTETRFQPHTLWSTGRFELGTRCVPMKRAPLPLCFRYWSLSSRYIRVPTCASVKTLPTCRGTIGGTPVAKVIYMA